MTRKDQFLAQKRVFRNDADAARAEMLRRYFDWCNSVRAQAGLQTKILLTVAVRLTVMVYVPMPESWSQKKRRCQLGTPHLVKPDADNFLKGLCDALFANDQLLYSQHIEKYWDDGGGPRMEVTIQ